MEPLVSVLMPVYNSEEFVAEAVDSILQQTFIDYEFLIIADRCTDNTINVIKEINDSRITIIQNNRNIGIAESLNKGMRQAKGKYIARMDSDDISISKRFEKQVKFMENNPHISVLGGWQQWFGQRNYMFKTFENHEYIKAAMLFANNVCHSTVLFRRNDFIDKGLFYDSRYALEDYELWLRAIEHNLFFANLQENLVYYRDRSDSITKITLNRNKTQEQQIYARLLKKLFIQYKQDYTLSDWYTFSKKYPLTQWRLRLVNMKKLLELMIEKNKEHCIYDQKALEFCANRYWVNQLNAPDEVLGAETKLPLEYIVDIIFEELNKKINSNFCIYGLGRIGLTILPYFQRHYKNKLFYLSDSDSSKWNKEFQSVKCIPPHMIPKEITIIVTTNFNIMVDVIANFKEEGYQNIFPFTELNCENKR